MTKVLPIILENALEEDKDNEFVKKNVDIKAIEIVIKEVKSVKDFNSAKTSAKKASDIYYAYASAYAKKNKVFTLKVLNLISKQGLDTLIEMKSLGVKWLSVTK